MQMTFLAPASYLQVSAKLQEPPAKDSHAPLEPAGTSDAPTALPHDLANQEILRGSQQNLRSPPASAPETRKFVMESDEGDKQASLKYTKRSPGVPVFVMMPLDTVSIRHDTVKACLYEVSCSDP